MKDLHWYFPKSLAEAADIVKVDKNLPHGGGTGLLLRKFSGIDGLIDLSQLPLNYIRTEGNGVEIGSMATYAEVVDDFNATDPNHILVKCLHHSANTPLRNRITIGGSIAMFPPWSDLIGALLALDAVLVLTGGNNGAFPVADYIRDQKLRAGSLITAVKFRTDIWRAAHYREIRTKSDMPTFNTTVLLKTEAGIITDSRIIVVGTVDKYQRLTVVEEYLQNRKTGDIKTEDIEKRVHLKFSSRLDDPDYANVKAAIELGRAIAKMVRN